MPKISFEEKKTFEQTEISQVVLPVTFGLADDLDLDVVLLVMNCGRNSSQLDRISLPQSN